MVQAVAEQSTYTNHNAASLGVGTTEAASATFRISDAVLPVAGTLVGSVLVGAAMVYFWDSIQGVGNWGYLSVFAAELGNSAAIILPTPGPAYTIAMALVLNPFAIGLLGGIAAMLGELVGYYLGRKGGRVIEGGRVYRRMESLSSRWGGKALLAFAVLPVPFDVAGIWAGTVRYPVWRFVVYVSAGKVIKVTSLALAASYGLTWVFGPLG